MRLHDVARPTLANGMPTFRKEGSHIPAIAVMPLAEPETVELRAMLRNYNTGSGFNYTYFTTQLHTSQLESFFVQYAENPEECLLNYFGWEDKHTINRQPEEPKPTLTQAQLASAKAQSNLSFL